MILAIDIGTSSCRSAIFTIDARRIAQTTAQQNYPLSHTPDGGAELDPEVLRRAIVRCVKQTLRHKKGGIIGVGTSCFWHSLIGVDENNRPLTPIYTWADSRCRADAEILRGEFSEKTIHARTGCMLRSSFWPAKMVWLQRTQPRLFRKVRHWMSPAEWLHREFLGTANCAIGMATGTGLFDPQKLDWDQELLARCNLTRDSLNDLTDAPIRSVSTPFRELKSTPWFPAIGDGAASNLGSGATQPGLAAINVGTSAALRVMKSGNDARAPFGLFCYRVDAERFLVGGAVSNAGNLRAWCLRELNLRDPEIESAMTGRPTPKHGLIALPFWTSERAPTWNENLRGAISGFSQDTSALDLLQALTEASYFRVAEIADMILHEEKVASKFIVSGGIQKSPSSLQRLANVLDQPVYPNDEHEASLRGAAIYALEKLGFSAPSLKLPRPIRPSQKIAEIYRRERSRCQQLEATLGRDDSPKRP